jgi:hypothetical protein
MGGGSHPITRIDSVVKSRTLQCPGPVAQKVETRHSWKILWGNQLEPSSGDSIKIN